MSDFTHNDTVLFGAPPGYSAGFAPAIKAAWRWLSAPVRGFFARELALREIHSLGDRDLADIGLSRSDIPAILRGIDRRKLDFDA